MCWSGSVHTETSLKLVNALMVDTVKFTLFWSKIFDTDTVHPDISQASDQTFLQILQWINMFFTVNSCLYSTGKL